MNISLPCSIGNERYTRIIRLGFPKADDLKSSLPSVYFHFRTCEFLTGLRGREARRAVTKLRRYADPFYSKENYLFIGAQNTWKLLDVDWHEGIIGLFIHLNDELMLRAKIARELNR